MTTRAILIACLLLLYAPSSHAWTWLNHVTIAQVAYEELSPSSRLYVDRVSDALYQQLTASPQGRLDNYTGASKFARLAALPDIVRNWHLATVYGSFGGTLPPAFQPHQGANTAPWHYINFSFPYESDCDLVVTPNLTEVLPVIETAFTEGADDQSKGIALAFLLHMVGDAHQPLHTTARATGTGAACTGDSGGNDFCLRRAASGLPIPASSSWRTMSSSSQGVSWGIVSLLSIGISPVKLSTADIGVRHAVRGAGKPIVEIDGNRGSAGQRSRSPRCRGS